MVCDLSISERLSITGGGGGALVGTGGWSNGELLINFTISLEQSACNGICVQRCSIMV